MTKKWLARRGALSGGLAAAVIGSAAAAPGAGLAWPGGHRSAGRDSEDEADEACARWDDAESATQHAPFRAAFLAWLEGAAERFALPVAADTASPAHTGLRIPGVHPAIWISLRSGGGINVGVEWDGVCWDLLACMDVAAASVPGGWENAFFVPEARLIHPTREAAWRTDGFEPLLDWVNDELAPATHVGLWHTEVGDATWAWLVRDGAILSSGRSIAGKEAPVHLLPVHAAGAVARVQRIGQARNGDGNGRATKPIGSAVQRGTRVYLYDERGRQLATIPAGNGPEDGLKGYTGATASVRRGGHVHTYDEKGRQLSMTPAR